MSRSSGNLSKDFSRHDSEYAHDDFNKRSIFIDNRSYDDSDVSLHDVFKSKLIPKIISMLDTFLKNADKHLRECENSESITPYMDAFEVREGNVRPYLVDFLLDVQNMHRVCAKYTKSKL